MRSGALRSTSFTSSTPPARPITIPASPTMLMSATAARSRRRLFFWGRPPAGGEGSGLCATSISSSATCAAVTRLEVPLDLPDCRAQTATLAPARATRFKPELNL